MESTHLQKVIQIQDPSWELLRVKLWSHPPKERKIKKRKKNP